MPSEKFLVHMKTFILNFSHLKKNSWLKTFLAKMLNLLLFPCFFFFFSTTHMNGCSCLLEIGTVIKGVGRFLGSSGVWYAIEDEMVSASGSVMLMP